MYGLLSLKTVEKIHKGVDNPNTLIIPDREKAIRKAIQELGKNEVLFILGKGDEEYQETKGKKIPFSDKDIVRSLL